MSTGPQKLNCCPRCPSCPHLSTLTGVYTLQKANPFINPPAFTGEKNWVYTSVSSQERGQRGQHGHGRVSYGL